jgi:hypothetical protein
MNEFLKYCNDNKHLPLSKSVLGRWFERQKKKIKNKDDELYKRLAVNLYAKISIDNMLQKRINKLNKNVKNDENDENEYENDENEYENENENDENENDKNKIHDEYDVN